MLAACAGVHWHEHAGLPRPLERAAGPPSRLWLQSFRGAHPTFDPTRHLKHQRLLRLHIMSVGQPPSSLSDLAQSTGQSHLLTGFGHLSPDRQARLTSDIQVCCTAYTCCLFAKTLPDSVYTACRPLTFSTSTAATRLALILQVLGCLLARCRLASTHTMSLRFCLFCSRTQAAASACPTGCANQGDFKCSTLVSEGTWRKSSCSDQHAINLYFCAYD